MCNSKSFDPSTSKGAETRLASTLRIFPAMRSTALALLRRSQFTEMNLQNEVVWKITDIVGSMDGSSKTSGDGWGVIGRNPVEVFD